jgi:methionyl-tRNA formyltransferase
MLEKRDGAVDWSQPAARVHDLVRGMNPRPGAFTRLGEKTVKIHATRRLDASGASDVPGTVVLADKSRVVVACGAGGVDRVELLSVQMEGRRSVSAGDWVGGRGVKERDVLYSVAQQ